MSRTKFDAERMREDIAVRGWQPADLADRAGVARSTVTRFLSGESQTARTAKKLAETMGYSTRRYLLSSREAVGAAR
jgi:transcriptional regulator with XRE-family HTH domain